MSNPRDDIDDILDEAQRETDAEFAATFTLSKDLLSAICPTPVDREKLARLLAAVNEAATENEAKQRLVEQIESCGLVVVKLLKKIVMA